MQIVSKKKNTIQQNGLEINRSRNVKTRGENKLIWIWSPIPDSSFKDDFVQSTFNQSDIWLT